MDAQQAINEILNYACPSYLSMGTERKFVLDLHCVQVEVHARVRLDGSGNYEVISITPIEQEAMAS